MTMDRNQWILCKIAEEANEVAHRALKAQQFGLDEIQENQLKDNLERLREEMHDLIVVYDMLDGPMREPPQVVRAEKHQKMKRYLKISEENGMVSKYDT